MAFISSGVTGDKIIIRTKKNMASNPAVSWHNSYELLSAAAWQLTDVQDAGSRIVEFERSFHTDEVVFSQFTASTWVEDSTPYDPLSFITVPMANNIRGVVAVDTAVDFEPLEIVAWVQRVVATGRQGKLFYRGVLAEAGVGAPAGRPVIIGTGLRVLVENAVTANLNPLFYNTQTTTSNPWNLAMIDKLGTTVRLVSDMILKGVTVAQRNRPYFDRV